MKRDEEAWRVEKGCVVCQDEIDGLVCRLQMFKSQSRNIKFLYASASQLNPKELTGPESYRGLERL